MSILYYFHRHHAPHCDKEASALKTVIRAIVDIEDNLAYPIKITEGKDVIWENDFKDPLDILEKLKKKLDGGEE